MLDLRSARHWAQALLCEALPAGGVAIDATMGNGGDTQFLCERVGDGGRVYALDAQQAALDRTRERLAGLGLLARARLICDGHQHVLRHVPENVDAAVFNLGWLPGGDKRYTTRVETTLEAVEACRTLLKPGALLTICAYPGHEEGARELEALRAWASALDAAFFQAMLRGYLNQPAQPPVLLAIQRIK